MNNSWLGRIILRVSECVVIEVVAVKTTEMFSSIPRSVIKAASVYPSAVTTG